VKYQAYLSIGFTLASRTCRFLQHLMHSGTTSITRKKRWDL